MENNELMTTEMEQEIVMDDYETECSGGGLGKLAVGAAIVTGVAALGAFAYNKCKDKLEERKIERLRKKGYVIFKEDECEVREIEEFEEDDVTIEPEN